MKLYELTIHKAHDLLKQKEITSQELTRAVLDRIETVDLKIGAYLTVAADLALAQAREADEAIAHGNTTPLTGVCRSGAAFGTRRRFVRKASP